MSSQNWRILTPSPHFVGFLLGKIGNFDPSPLPRRYSLWMDPKGPSINNVINPAIWTLPPPPITTFLHLLHVFNFWALSLKINWRFYLWMSPNTSSDFLTGMIFKSDNFLTYLWSLVTLLIFYQTTSRRHWDYCQSSWHCMLQRF